MVNNEAVNELRKGLTCLRLECNESIVDDLSRLADEAIKSVGQSAVTDYLINNKCQFCKHWRRDLDDEYGYGDCQHILDWSTEKPKVDEPHAVIACEQGTIVGLHTSPDFGCRLFETPTAA
jgi:hypothetical protein